MKLDDAATRLLQACETLLAGWATYRREAWDGDPVPTFLYDQEDLLRRAMETVEEALDQDQEVTAGPPAPGRT